MKIIDFDRKGNVVRFYLGDDNCDDYWGDDWNDVPYDCNSGMVYNRFIKGYTDISFPFDCLVLEPCSGDYSCRFSKEDMKKQNVPCVISIPYSKPDKDNLEYENWIDDRFSTNVGKANAIKFYFGDKMEPDVLIQTEQ